MILERFTHRCQSPVAKFIEIASTDVVLGKYLGSLLSAKERHHGL
jgi:hypothetical protein